LALSKKYLIDYVSLNANDIEDLDDVEDIEDEDNDHISIFSNFRPY